MPNWYCEILFLVISHHLSNGAIRTKHRKWPENSFAQTFVPLSSGDWDFEQHVVSGEQNDLRNVQVLSDDDDENVFSFSFESVWSPPNYLWNK